MNYHLTISLIAFVVLVFSLKFAVSVSRRRTEGNRILIKEAEAKGFVYSSETKSAILARTGALPQFLLFLSVPATFTFLWHLVYFIFP